MRLEAEAKQSQYKLQQRTETLQQSRKLANNNQ